jgi:hypothetical protein
MMIIRQHNRSARHSGLGPGACAHKRTRAADGASASIRVTRDAAACVAGELRTLRFTLHHIRRVIREANATAFLAAHGHVDDDLLADPLWANWSVTQKLLPTLRAGTMQAYTLSKCLPLVEGHEESTCTTFSWIIRLRTDGWYNFHWNGSSWWPPRNPHTVVYVTHCMGSANILDFQNNKKAVTCTDRYPHQSGCASDQFAVISRGVARAYFVTFLRKMLDTGQIRDYANVTLSTSAPPECVLSSALAWHNVQ